MNPLALLYDYHDRTKHYPNRYAASLGYMDWATQPNPFRYYDGAKRIDLPLISPDDSPAYAELFTPREPQPLTPKTLATMLQYSLGLAAWKQYGSDRWALRCNASSGNLHPTEATVILPPIEGISQRSVVAHYAPRDHALEILCEFDTDIWTRLSNHSFFLAISSVLWREVWKYGERAFRYTQLDAGHAEQSVRMAARLNGWNVNKADRLSIKQLDRLTGLDQTHRYHPEEREVADMLLCVNIDAFDTSLLDQLLTTLPEHFAGTANQLSHAHHHWDAIDTIADVTHLASTSDYPPVTMQRELRVDMAAMQIMLKRRSAQAMDFGRTHIEKEVLLQLLESVAPDQIDGYSNANLVLFVHDVQDLVPGLYLYVRNSSHRNRLQHLMRQDFEWQEAAPRLYLLEARDFRSQAKFISCSQDIASDSAFSLGMLCEFEPQIEQFGPHRYKELYWECGAIGQQLYLEATALQLSATGIGCFLDDVMHRLLGLDTHEFQTLYHFTVGRAIADMRITTLPPYEHKE